MSKILFIAVLLGLYSLSREVMANTAPEEKSNDNIVVGKDFSVSSACIPPNMQTIVMQVLLASAHVNSRISQTKPSHYLSLREDRFSTELRECF